MSIYTLIDKTSIATLEASVELSLSEANGIKHFFYYPLFNETR